MDKVKEFLENFFEAFFDKIKESSENFYTKHPELCLTAIIYFFVVTISKAYAPWKNDELSDLVDSVVPASTWVEKIINDIFYVGMSDVIEIFYYSLSKFDENGKFVSTCLIFFSFFVFVIQKVIADKIIYKYDECNNRNKLEKIVIGYMIGNITFSLSAYIIYFLYPSFYNAFLNPQRFATLAYIAAFFLMLLSFPGIIYLSVYVVCYLLGYLISYCLINYLPLIINFSPAFNSIIVLLISGYLAIIMDKLATKAQYKTLKIITEKITDFIPFLSPVFEFLDDLFLDNNVY